MAAQHPLHLARPRLLTCRCQHQHQQQTRKQELIGRLYLPAGVDINNKGIYPVLGGTGGS
eukprot:946045-Pyramimonas_sp.AAC.1